MHCTALGATSLESHPRGQHAAIRAAKADDRGVAATHRRRHLADDLRVVRQRLGTAAAASAVQHQQYTQQYSISSPPAQDQQQHTAAQQQWSASAWVQQQCTQAAVHTHAAVHVHDAVQTHTHRRFPGTHTYILFMNLKLQD